MDLPKPLKDLQQDLQRTKLGDYAPQLTKFYSKYAKDKEMAWEVVTQICPICESAIYLALASKPGKNKGHEVLCKTCNSNSSKRTIECVDFLTIHLKHVDARE